MNYKHIFFTAAIALMATVGCNKMQSNPDGESEQGLTIGVGREQTEEDSKAYIEGLTMKWDQSVDTLIVIDQGLAGTDFLCKSVSEDKTSATFSTSYWTGNVPTYACCYFANYDEKRVKASPSDGVMTVRVRPSQNFLKWKGCSSPLSSAMVGKVDFASGKYSISQMKNVVGYIKINLATTNVAKVRVTAIGGEPVSGWVDVDYAKLVNGDADFWTLTSGKTAETTATIQPGAGGNCITADGCFAAAAYCIAVLPQTYSNGLRFTMVDKDGATICTKTIGGTSGVTIERNSVVTLPALDLPNEVTIDLYFGNSEGVNPLGTFKTAAQQAVAGESYDFTYNYSFDSKEYSLVLPVKLSKGSGGSVYSYVRYTNNVYGAGYVLDYSNKAANGWLELPAINGMYLQAVKVCTGNGANKNIAIKDRAASASVASGTVIKGTTSSPGEKTIHFYTDGNDGDTAFGTKTTTRSKAYSVYMTSAGGTRINRITATYTGILPTR